MKLTLHDICESDVPRYCVVDVHVMQVIAADSGHEEPDAKRDDLLYCGGSLTGGHSPLLSHTGSVKEQPYNTT